MGRGEQPPVVFQADEIRRENIAAIIQQADIQSHQQGVKEEDAHQQEGGGQIKVGLKMFFNARLHNFYYAEFGADCVAFTLSFWP